MLHAGLDLSRKRLDYCLLDEDGVRVVSGSRGARYCENGTSPSTTAGLDILAGGGAELANLANVKIRSTSGSPNVQIAYRRYNQ